LMIRGIAYWRSEWGEYREREYVGVIWQSVKRCGGYRYRMGFILVGSGTGRRDIRSHINCQPLMCNTTGP
jgi:hypothetical protein